MNNLSAIILGVLVGLCAGRVLTAVEFKKRDKNFYDEIIRACNDVADWKKIVMKSSGIWNSRLEVTIFSRRSKEG